MRKNNPGTGWEWLRDGFGTIAEETTRQSAVEANRLGEAGDRKTTLIEFVDRRAVVLLGKWIVENDSVGLIIATNSNTI